MCCTLSLRVRPETASGSVPKLRQRATGVVDPFGSNAPDSPRGSIDGYTEARLRRKLWRVMFPDEALGAYLKKADTQRNECLQRRSCNTCAATCGCESAWRRGAVAPGQPLPPRGPPEERARPGNQANRSGGLPGRSSEAGEAPKPTTKEASQSSDGLVPGARWGGRQPSLD